MNYVVREQVNKVSIIRMDHEKRMNSLEKDFRDELKIRLKEYCEDPKSRVAILTGSGKAFCAGGSLGELSDGMSAEAGVNYMEEISEIVRLITGAGKPIIASVNGAAVGAGFTIAMSCDLVMASRDAIFSLPFLKVGLIPDLGGNYFLPRIVGLHKAKELVFTGETLSGRRAFDMGLVNHVLAPDELMPFSLEMAERIAQGPAKATELSKTLLSKSLDLSLDDVLAYEAIAQAVCFQSADHREGVKAFYEKRAPDFSGQ
jgi:2-(1,2-epoxy-1,2-dihydrophenyl)acetyl-CoA isomerase